MMASRSSAACAFRCGPVVVDATVTGPVSVGGGAHGVALTVNAEELTRALDAVVADVTEPAR